MNQPTPSLTLQTNPHYERLGGYERVVRLVDAFYRAMDALPEAATIRAMHEADLRVTKSVLVKYLSEWMGGPKLYTPERGAPMLRRRHHPFSVDEEARDAWMLCMRQALDDVCEDAALRSELDAAFFKIADFIRNTETSGSDRAHTGHPRESGFQRLQVSDLTRWLLEHPRALILDARDADNHARGSLSGSTRLDGRNHEGFLAHESVSSPTEGAV